MDKSSGWYYVGDGKLRFRDDYGWTEYYMDTSDPRAQTWPPPAPKTLLQQLRDEERTASAKVPRRRAVLRGRRSGSV
ncbi:hypothetical protein [Terrabacter sp. C0L_2]|uniref:hypothetical protein n=1 Tax=Terrabacter sp. C0L_2 TaxID=3108389 RepID=UPI002ED3E059|nr:hypothetical protein U5C87_08035 [Terrabacter sp. C0L_2]